MTYPKLVCPNLFSDIGTMRSFAMDYGFHGIDWTLRPEELPTDPRGETRLADALAELAPLEIRYHLFFQDTEVGNTDPVKARSAKKTYSHALHLVSRLPGNIATVHVGLGRDCMEGISWHGTLAGLADLAATARTLGVRMCLENLIRGWTSEPDLYEKLLRKTGCAGTLDVGHAHVCDSVSCGAYDIDDFAMPHPARILNAHIYHTETEQGHVPPSNYEDLETRLHLLSRLPLCDWWVLELREEKALLQTLDCVKEFLRANPARAAM